MNHTDVLLRLWHVPASRKAMRLRVLHGTVGMLCKMALPQDCLCYKTKMKIFEEVKNSMFVYIIRQETIKIQLKNYQSVKNKFLKDLF